MYCPVPASFSHILPAVVVFSFISPTNSRPPTVAVTTQAILPPVPGFNSDLKSTGPAASKAGLVLMPENFSPPKIPSAASVEVANSKVPSLIPKWSPSSSAPVSGFWNTFSAGVAVMVKFPPGWAFPPHPRVMALFILLLKSERLVNMAFLFTCTVMLESLISEEFTTISEPEGKLSSALKVMDTLASVVAFSEVIVNWVPLIFSVLDASPLDLVGMFKWILSEDGAFPSGSPDTPRTV